MFKWFKFFLPIPGIILGTYFLLFVEIIWDIDVAVGSRWGIGEASAGKTLRFHLIFDSSIFYIIDFLPDEMFKLSRPDLGHSESIIIKNLILIWAAGDLYWQVLYIGIYYV